MKYNFCTLFDVNFIHRGLALYNSCTEYCGDNFVMWVLCLDEKTQEILNKLALPRVKIITLSDLSDPELIAVRSGRSNSEFAWTCKPALINHVINSIEEGQVIIYLDADLYLFSSPESALRELNGNSILITPHRFPSAEKAKAEAVGFFNAGVILMRKDDTSRQCLERWRAQCLEWCFTTLDKGRLGDQMYLNEWPILYPGTISSANIGLNVGSWNIRGNSITKKGKQIFIANTPLLMYHFHGFRIYVDHAGKLHGYPVSIANDIIYKQYVIALNKAVQQIKNPFPGFQPVTNSYPGILRLWKQIALQYWRRINRT